MVDFLGKDERSNMDAWKDPQFPQQYSQQYPQQYTQQFSYHYPQQYNQQIPLLPHQLPHGGDVDFGYMLTSMFDLQQSAQQQMNISMHNNSGTNNVTHTTKKIQKRKLDTTKVKTKRKIRKRFFWTDETHTLFIKSIFELGMKTTEVPLVVCHQHVKEQKNLKFQSLYHCIKMFQNSTKWDDIIHIFLEHFDIVKDETNRLCSSSGNKSSFPSFHVFPLCDKYMKFVDENLGKYGLFVLGSIFDVGLQLAKPKTLFKALQGCIPELGTENVKSHLQKYRQNSVRTRDSFFVEFPVQDISLETVQDALESATLFTIEKLIKI